MLLVSDTDNIASIATRQRQDTSAICHDKALLLIGRLPEGSTAERRDLVKTAKAHQAASRQPPCLASHVLRKSKLHYLRRRLGAYFIDASKSAFEADLAGR